MPHIDFDLSNYEDDIKELYCNSDCLMGKCPKRSFKEYVEQLERDKIYFNEEKDYNRLIAELKEFI